MPSLGSPVGAVAAAAMWDPDGAGPSPELLVVGSIAPGPSVVPVAAWNPVTCAWTAFASAAAAVGGVSIRAMAIGPGGDLIVAGHFDQIDGVAAANVARFDGTAWHAMGQGSLANVRDLTTMPNGDVLAYGLFDLGGGNNVWLARWDGVAWSQFGPVAGTGPTNSLHAFPNGDVIAGGVFTSFAGVPANFVARYSGGSWSAMGGGVNSTVHAAVEMPNGDIVIGGSFTMAEGNPAMGAARWDGTMWHAMPGLPGVAVRDLLVLQNGDVIAVGDFNHNGQGVGPEYVARWSGSTWTNITSGLEVDWRSWTITALPNAEFVVGGEGHLSGGNPSAALQRFSPTCPAVVSSHGTGCIGAGGLNTLAAITQPWAGTTFRMRGEGMASNALVVAVTGFTQTSLPLASLLPQGGAGCALLASPDLLEILLPWLGGVDSPVVLPNSSALAGLSFHHQLVSFELLVGNIAAVTSTNALTMTIASL